MEPAFPNHHAHHLSTVRRSRQPRSERAETSGHVWSGHIQPTLFFARKPSKIIWGVGPALLLPTATDDALGSGKWSIGPSVVALVQPVEFTIGALVRRSWSFAGSSS